jgi:hypothetical protein
MFDRCPTTILGIAVILGFVLANGDQIGALARIDSMTPTKGSSGQTALVHGSGFSSGQVSVRFGQTGAVAPGDVHVLNDQVVRFTIPAVPVDQRDPFDPNVAPVNVNVAAPDGTTTAAFRFTFNPPGQQPAITEIRAVDDAGMLIEPLMAGGPFELMLSGASFITATGRTPTMVALLGDAGNSVLAGPASATATSIAVSFPTGIPEPDIYQVIVGFSDDAAASASTRLVVSAPPSVAAECSADPGEGAAPLMVQFRAIPVGGTGMYGFRWEFGEPGSLPSTEQNPVHTYQQVGTYSAVVRVTSPPQDPANPAAGTFADCQRIVTVH